MSSKQSRSPSKFDPRAWATFADQALEALKGSQYGGRVQTYMWLGEQFGLEHSVVRRIVAARQFLLKLESEYPDLARKLTSVPYPAIDPFRRWYARDKASALAAAWKAVRGETSVRTLRASEKAARKPSSITEMSIKEREEFAISAVEKELPKGYRRAPLGIWAGSSIDSIFEFRDQTGKTDLRRRKYAVMVVGPFANAKVYDHRRADLLLQVAGAISLGFDVIVVLAEPKAIPRYESVLKELGLQNVEVRVIAQPHAHKIHGPALSVG